MCLLCYSKMLGRKKGFLGPVTVSALSITEGGRLVPPKVLEQLFLCDAKIPDSFT